MCEIVQAHAPVAARIPLWRQVVHHVLRWHERSRQRTALAELARISH